MILLDDCKSSAQTPSSLFFENPLLHWRVFHIQELANALEEMEAAQADGHYVVALFSYELGEALQGIRSHKACPLGAVACRDTQARSSSDATNDTGARSTDTPLLLEAFAFSQCERRSNEQVIEWLQTRISALPEHERTAGLLDVRGSLSEDDYACDIAAIQAYIAKGDTYQVNHTFQLRAQSFGHPLALYARLRARQPVRYGAFIETPERQVLCFSPELFIKNEEGLLTAKPMKGTLGRLHAKAEDLSSNEKDRAENVMITDLIRNDLGRICETGSIKVPALFDVEEVGEVYQMTSTITGRLKLGLSLHDILQASFPCGSVTGAPKKRTMEIIAQLEPHDRGLYCGSIGLFEPNGNFQLNVVIRTLEVNAKRDVTIGIGSGITIDSSASNEWQECAVKAGFVTGLSSPVGLIETLRVENGHPLLLALHLNRMQSSAKALGIAFNRPLVERKVEGLLKESLHTPQGDKPEGLSLLRLELSPDGDLQIRQQRIDPVTGPQKIFWAKDLIGEQVAIMKSSYRLLSHKVTARAQYDAAWRAAVARGGFDALFTNERGEVTEGGRSSIFVFVNGAWITPPLRCGVLSGVMRTTLLTDWAAKEELLYPEDLHRAQRIVVVSALRGVIDATLDIP